MVLVGGDKDAASLRGVAESWAVDRAANEGLRGELMGVAESWAGARGVIEGRGEWIGVMERRGGAGEGMTWDGRRGE